ncbi:MAG TPA: GAF domain-containing protein [Streptosporangiaceae bacterium]|nr:GAF domain-containing protein [Streptosporangiaceae bacterium]
MPSTNPPSLPPSALDGTDITQRGLLQSVVEAARVVFGAMAASVFLIDRASGDLVFEAVAGEGEDQLVGTRFPVGTGIAGWVAMCGEPMLVDDVSEAPQFARDAAESTGYVPRSIMAAPLIRAGECIGVLEVLDRGSRLRGELADVDLLGLLATEMAMALDMLARFRWSAGPGGGGAAAGLSAAALADAQVLQRVAERLPAAPAPVASTVSRLLAMADQLLSEADAAGSSVRA